MDVDNELCSLMLCEQFANADHSIVPLGSKAGEIPRVFCSHMQQRLDSLKPYPQMEMRYLEAACRVENSLS